MAMFTLLRIPRVEGQILQPKDGLKYEALGGQMLFKTVADHSAGGVSVLEYKIPPQFPGPPAHYHKKAHEGFYCLEGTLGIEMDGRREELRPGAYAFVPPHVIHRFWNPTSAPVKFLGVITPGGFERYFREVTEMAKAEGTWPPRDMRKLIELGEKYDSYFAPPVEQ